MHSRRTLLVILCGLIFSSAGMPLSAATIIHAGELLDVNEGVVLSQQTIIVVGNRITTVAPGYHEGSADDLIIDLKNAFVMPGLLDMHVHIVTETSPDGVIRRFTDEPGDYAYRSVPHARRTLLGRAAGSE